MPGQQDKPSPAKAEDDKPAAERRVQVVVAPRRSVMSAADGLRQRRHGPGDMLEVSLEDAMQLRAGGFVLTNSTDAPSPPPQRIVSEDRRPLVNGGDGGTIAVAANR